MLAGFACGITSVEWCLVLIAIGAVLSVEAVNTALEFLSDVVSPHYDPLIAHVKDLSAAAVLIAASLAALIGMIIFVPYLKFVLDIVIHQR